MSDFFQWDKQYQFHIQLIDSEHKELINLMNDLYDKYESKSSHSEIEYALNKLASYTIKHFEDEEKYFDSIKFPGADSHKIIHKQMLGKVQEYVDDFKTSGSLNADFFTFLKVWLKSHILGIDVKYANHAKSSQVA